MKKYSEDEICILLPVFNGAKFLAEQLDSLVIQSHKNWHCLIRDDGSTDESVKIIDEYCSLNPTRFIKISDSYGNVGIIESLNLLSKQVDAPYFALCDQDDVWQNDRLQLTLKAVKNLEQAKSEPALSYSDLELVDDELNTIGDSFWNHRKLIKLSEDLRSIPVFNAYTGCTMLGNKALLDIAFPIPKYVPMHDYWIALVTKYIGRASAVKKPLIRYRQHSGNQCGAGQTYPNLFKRALSRIFSIRDFFEQGRKLRRIRIKMLQELIARTGGLYCCVQLNKAIAAENGSVADRIAFLRSNRIPISRAFVYWLA